MTNVSMASLHNLPNEILLHVTEYLECADIYSLQQLNTRMYSLLCKKEALGGYIITQQMNMLDPMLTNQDMYMLLTYFIIDAKTNCGQNVQCLRVSRHNCVNALFHKLLSHYLKTGTISDYHNIIELYMFYGLLQVTILQNYRNANYYIPFVYSMRILNKKSMRIIAYEYYTYLLINSCLDSNTIHLENLYCMSKICVSIPLVSKLFDCRRLILDTTQLLPVFRLDRETELCLHKVVEYKFGKPHDLFVSSNYISLKSFLEKHNPTILNIVHSYELRMINKLIVYKHPFVNKHIKLSSTVSSILLNNLRREDPLLFKTVRKVIKRKQKYFQYYYFT